MSFIEEKSIEEKLRENIVLSLDFVWDYKIDPSLIKIETTKYGKAIILYPLVKLLKLPLEEFGTILGDCILFYTPEISKYELVKGFLNLELSDNYLISRLFYVMDYCKELERRSVENKPSVDNNFFKNIYTPKTKDES